MVSSSTIPTWILYVFFGIVVPVIILIVSLVPSDVSVSNVSILCIAVILHNHMFHITLPPPDHSLSHHLNVHRAISLVVIGCMCCLLFGIPDYVAPPPPNALNLDTGRCHPFWQGNLSSAEVCRSFHYYTALEPEAESQFAITTFEGTLRDNALQHGIQQIIGAYDKIQVSTGEDKYRGVEAFSDETVRCQGLFQRLACSVMFPPCSGDCTRSIRVCRRTCFEYLTSCSHATRMYDLMGPTSLLRPLVMPPDVNINPVYFAIDRLMMDFKEKCSNDSRFTDNEEECGNDDYKPREAGHCNETTRSEDTLKFRMALSKHAHDVDAVNDRQKTLRTILYGLYFVTLFVNCVALWVYTLCVSSKTTLSDRLRQSSEYWSRWRRVYPVVVTLAIPIQAAAIVVVQLSAREAETRGVYYVAVFEYIVCLFEFNVMVDTVTCYVRISK
eukprot:PhF_6_TR29314/c1_g1_i1/m.43003